MAESRFSYVIYVRTTAEKLWQALTQPEFTRRYWYDASQECEWQVGALWKIVMSGGKVADSGEVIAIERCKMLEVKWRNEMFAEMTAEGYSRMRYVLEEKDGVVKLSLEHWMEKEESKLIAAVSTGWPIILSSLKSLLETGEALAATTKDVDTKGAE